MRAERLPIAPEREPVMGWGSDAIAELLGRLDLEYISLVPGASYRGLHDSLVNYLGNEKPRMLLCLHEEHAVALAQGYAKVTGRPMAVALHSNVGLMHAAMAMFNAYCDRVPMLVLGATGPVDAASRRPWIDWIHTAADQGALIRNYCKWDDQPGSVEAALEAVMRAYLLTQARPTAPTYVCLDAAIQEEALEAPMEVPQPDHYQVPAAPAPQPGLVARAARLLREAERPLLLVGRVGRSQAAWDARVNLAERLGACVLTDLKTPASFPTRHRLHPAVPGTRVTSSGTELMRRADLILSLAWIDIGGTLSVALGGRPRPAVISCTDEVALSNGWSKDHFNLAPTEMSVFASPDLLVDALLDSLGGEGETGPRDGWTIDLGSAGPAAEERSEGEDGLRMSDLAAALREALAGRDHSYVALPHGWRGSDVDTRGPLDYLGRDGGGGVGSGPGIAVGAALALDAIGRLPVAVLGDGDYLMGSSALWTASHHRLPLLVVVANNRSYYNDEVHQERMARRRSRPVGNRSVGLHLRDPDPDLAALARSYGLRGHGPVETARGLESALASAVAEVEKGKAAVVDVRVSPHGYGGADDARSRALGGRSQP